MFPDRGETMNHNFWKTTDIIGSPEVKENDLWLSKEQVNFLIESIRGENDGKIKN